MSSIWKTGAIARRLIGMKSSCGCAYSSIPRPSRRHFIFLACVGSSAKIQDLDSIGSLFPTNWQEQFGVEELYDGDELIAPTARYREMRITLIERLNQRLPIGPAHAI
jgi:hypothetical protein